MKFSAAKTQELDQKTRDLLKSLYRAEEGNFEKGLFISGGTGVGKTYTLNAIKNHVERLPNRSNTDVENWVELLMELKGTFETKHTDPLKFIRENVTNKRFIFLDDVGAEKQTEWSQEMLYLIINKAYELERTLFIATNLSFKEFSDKYGDRLTSRIVEMCEMKEVTGEDRRLK